MSSKAGEISSIIKQQIQQYENRVEMKENGTVITVGDGIATVYGLRSCMANELLRFEDGSFGVAQNLEEETARAPVFLPGRVHGQGAWRGVGYELAKSQTWLSD